MKGVRPCCCRNAVMAESDAAGLVVGAQSHGRLRHALLGSVAHSIFRWTRSPVTIIQASSTSTTTRKRQTT